MEMIENIMFVCCILYNMIVDNERDEPGLENILAQYMGDNAPMHCRIFFEDFAISSTMRSMTRLHITIYVVT